MCQRTLTQPEAVDCFFLNYQKKRKDTLSSELVFTRNRDIDFRFIK